MYIFVKWRAGQLKGHTQQLLNRLQICLFCMEEFETFDLPQVVAALTNLLAKTLVTVGDVNQRVELCGRGGRRATFKGRGSSVAPSLLVEDGEKYDAGTMSVAHPTITVPEARPWYE